MESCCNPRGLYGSPERTRNILLIYFPSLIWFEHKDHCSKFLIFVKHENGWKRFILSESLFKASFSPSVKCEVGKRKFFQDPWLIFCFLLILSQKKVLSEAFFCYCNTRFNHTRLKCLKQLEMLKRIISASQKNVIFRNFEIRSRKTFFSPDLFFMIKMILTKSNHLFSCMNKVT